MKIYNGIIIITILAFVMGVATESTSFYSVVYLYSYISGFGFGMFFHLIKDYKDVLCLENE